jgi:antitoxin VapB
MALHIRSSRVDKLARELSERTGETLTEAIAQALSERLDRFEAADRDSEQATFDELMEISNRIAELLRKAGVEKSSTELLDELYDEHGLPR